MMKGKHLLRTWSSTQPSIAMSSAEAEYYALVEGATRSLGLQSIGTAEGYFLADRFICCKEFCFPKRLGPNAAH